MKFKKLSDNKIKCIISKEEMEANGIDVGDFLMNQDKTHEFVRDIMKQACDVLGIVPTGSAYSVQMTVNQNGDLSLVITPNFEESLKSVLSEIKDHLLNLKDNLDDAEVGKALADFLPGSLAKEKAKELADKMTNKAATESLSENTDSQPEKDSDKVGTKKYENIPFWCVYSSIDECIAVAKSLQGLDFNEAELYKFEDKYYLRLRTAVNTTKLSSIVLTVSEFGMGMFTEPTDGAYIKEHGRLISNDPISELGCL